MLSDASILERISWGQVVIDPFDIDRLQPASVDLTLAPSLLVPFYDGVIDIRTGEGMDQFTHVRQFHSYVLEPGEFVLGCTAERVELGPQIVGRFEGKSSLGRLGLLTHITAGFIDPGFRGYITVELHNANTNSIRIYPGMPIGQIAFDELDRAATHPYGEESGAHYADQDEPVPVPSRLRVPA